MLTQVYKLVKHASVFRAQKTLARLALMCCTAEQFLGLN